MVEGIPVHHRKMIQGPKVTPEVTWIQIRRKDSDLSAMGGATCLNTLPSEMFKVFTIVCLYLLLKHKFKTRTDQQIVKEW